MTQTFDANSYENLASGESLKILHVFRAPLGGLFRHVVDVTRGQIKRGHKVGIFCDLSTGGQQTEQTFAELEPNLSLGLKRVPMQRRPHPTDIMALRSFKDFYNQTLPDVIHCHGSKGGFYGRMVSLPANHKTIRVYTPHGGSFNYYPGSISHQIYMAVERFLAKRTNLFLFESHYIANCFNLYIGSKGHNVRVVHNGIDDAEFELVQNRTNEFDLLYLGELRAAKGIDTLFQALSKIRKSYQEKLSLLVVGSGPDEAVLKEYAETLGIADAVTFAPPSPIRKAIAKAELMVIPSRAESLPYVVLEAAGSGQPLVSTNVGGIPEIFGPYQNQLILPDQVDVMADTIRAKRVQTYEDREKAAIDLQTYIRGHFTIQNMIDQGLKYYHQALEKRSPT